MLILVLFHSQCARPVEKLIWRSISSASKSVTVLPSSTLPMRLTAPESKSMAEVRDVFPEPPCPTIAMFLMLAVS